MIDRPLETLIVDRRDDVVTVTLNRPAARNAINFAMCDELIALFDALGADPSVRLVLIKGTGPVFCAGIDMHEVKARADSAEWYATRRNRGLDAYLAIDACAAPVVAVVDGPAIGGGCEIAASADFIVASDAASFRYPEALFGAIGATQRLPRRVGAALAKELLFTGRAVAAGEALAIGLINRLVPPAELDAAVDGFVVAIVAADPAAVRGIKRAITDGLALDVRSAVDIERRLIAASLDGPGWRAGADRFSAAVGSAGRD